MDNLYNSIHIFAAICISLEGTCVNYRSVGKVGSILIHEQNEVKTITKMGVYWHLLITL